MTAGDRWSSPLRHWPDVPTRFLQGRDDRVFPVEFQRRLVKERLGITIEELPGGHLVALSRPRELAEMLCSDAPAFLPHRPGHALPVTVPCRGEGLAVPACHVQAVTDPRGRRP